MLSTPSRKRKTEDIRRVHINLLLQLANFNEYFIILAKCLFYSHRFSKSRFLQRKKVILTESKSTMYSGVFKLRLYKGDKDALTPQTAEKALIFFMPHYLTEDPHLEKLGIDSPACRKE